MIRLIFSGLFVSTIVTGAFISGALLGKYGNKKIIDKIKKLSIKKNNSASID